MNPGQLLQVVLLGMIWGSSYLFVKVAVEGIDPVTLVAGRLAIGAAVLHFLIRLRGMSLPSTRTLWLHIAVMSLVGNVTPFLLIAWGQQHIASGLGAILNATTPFFTILFVVGIFQAERLTSGRVLGLVLAFLGVAVLTGADLADLGASSAQGQIALLLSSVCYGFAFAYARRFLSGEPLVLAGSQMLIALVMLLPIVPVAGQVTEMELTAARLASWLALGAVSSGIAYLIYYRLIAEIGATAASFATYLMPIAGVFWGWLLLGEQFGINTFAGIALILLGLVATSGRRSKQPISPDGAGEREPMPTPAQTTSPHHR